MESFSGKQGDKEYRFLDEMLTRLLIKLDNIDSQGFEEVRMARKSSIVSVQQTVSLLESKVRKNSVINNVLKKEEEERRDYPSHDKRKKEEMDKHKPRRSKKKVKDKLYQNRSCYIKRRMNSKKMRR